MDYIASWIWYTTPDPTPEPTEDTPKPVSEQSLTTHTEIETVITYADVVKELKDKLEERNIQNED